MADEKNRSIRGRQRNAGIDAARLFAAFAVVALHTMNRGKLLGGEGTDAWKTLGWYLQAALFLAVDAYGVMAGYVAHVDDGRPFRYARAAELWLTAVFWGVVVTGGYAMFAPSLVTREDWMKSLFPLWNDSYWYLTAWFFLTLLIPFLNAGVRAMTRREAGFALFGVFAVASVFASWNDLFRTTGGYSGAWLAVLYLIGALARKSGLADKVRPAVGFVAWLALSAASFATCYKGLGSGVGLIKYTSPTETAAALALVCAFSNLKIGEKASRRITAASAGAFSVYLINMNPTFWRLTMDGLFDGVGLRGIPVALLTLVGFAGGFTACALAADALRRRLFHAVGVGSALDAAEAWVRRLASGRRGRAEEAAGAEQPSEERTEEETR